MFFSFFDEIFAHKFVRLRFCFVLNPLFICLIGSDFSEADDTWHLVFVEGFYRGFHDFPVLDAGLVDGCNFFTFGEYAFPPEDTLHRIVVHTGNKTLMEEFSTHSDGFWLGWMGDVDQEEGHKTGVREICFRHSDEGRIQDLYRMNEVFPQGVIDFYELNFLFSGESLEHLFPYESFGELFEYFVVD
jgi:hypothetical protein